jgi:hypothetical protein
MPLTLFPQWAYRAIGDGGAAKTQFRPESRVFTLLAITFPQILLTGAHGRNGRVEGAIEKGDNERMTNE